MSPTDEYQKFSETDGILWTFYPESCDQCGLNQFTYSRQRILLDTRSADVFMTEERTAWVVGGREQALLLVNAWNKDTYNGVVWKYIFIR